MIIAVLTLKIHITIYVTASLPNDNAMAPFFVCRMYYQSIQKSKTKPLISISPDPP